MFGAHKQSGRSRVNKVREGKIHKKQKQSPPLKKLSHLDKLRSIHRELLLEGYTLSEYKKYVQEKINKDKYYYKHLSDDDINTLHESFQKLVQTDDNWFNQRDDIRDMKRKQRKNFRQKRKECYYEYNSQLIGKLFEELEKIPVGRGVLRVSKLSKDPKHWKQTKNYLFIGGNYLEDIDKRWTSIYSKLGPMSSSSLFDVAFCGSEELKESYLNVS